MAKRAARPILEDMLAYAEEACAILEQRDGAALRADRIRLLPVTRALELIGEAATRLPNDVVGAISFDVRPAIAMRHRLIHGYDTASADIIAKTVREDLPPFMAALRDALAGPLPDGS